MNRPAPIVSLERLDDRYDARVEDGLARVGFFATVPAGSRVFLKPNLTFPEYRPGVMTSFECLRATTECLANRGYRVIIGEADSGGYNRFSMDAVFEGLGVPDLARRTGARVVNLSFEEPVWLEVRSGLRKVRFPMPRLLLEGIDAFITLPVPKIHMNTMVSLSLKNQWGCITVPEERLKLHPYFAEVIHEVNSRLPNAHAIVDGRVGLNRSGPMNGDVVELNWLMASNDLVATERICLELMQIPEARVAYLRHFRRQGWWPELKDIRIDADLAAFRGPAFHLRRLWTDLPGLACFHNSFLAWLGYRSPVSGFAHWLLYLFREPFYDYEAERRRRREIEHKR